MKNKIPNHVIETLLSLGMENKEFIKNDDQLIELLKGLKKYCSGYGSEDWQVSCESLSRESHILLFKGLIYADIIAWGPSCITPVNCVFSKLNSRCWPDTVYSLIRWAINVCEYHEFGTEDYDFAGMLENR